jgi:hypothetical protein
MIQSVPMRRVIATVALAITVGVGQILINSPICAAESWFSGDAFNESLRQKVGITWSNIPVRHALESFSKSQRLAVILDRRVDPDQKIELALTDVPLQETLEQIASRLQIGVTCLGPVIYFGPKQTVDRLRTVVALRNEEVGRLPSTVRSVWTQTKPWKWEMLSTPRDLVSGLAQENGLKIEGLEQIPADLWAAADLPPLPLAQRLSLVLAQFDLSFQMGADGKSLRLVPMPEKPVVEQTYPVSGLPQDVLGQLRQNNLLAGAEIGITENKLRVRGRQEDQEIVQELLAGHTAHRTTVAERRKVYTLRVELPVGKLLEALGPQMGTEIQLNKSAIAAAGISLEQKVQVNVKEVSADELLQAVLDPAGLTFVRRENVVEIKPK